MTERSLNSWVNKDEPRDVSSMSRHKDCYEDMLEERRTGSDMKFCVKKRPNVPHYKYSTPISPAETIELVLQSDRVTYTVEMLHSELGISKEELRKEAKEIVEDMAHNFRMKAVRFFAYFLVKVFKALYNRIYVNEENIQMLRKLLNEYPVILLPSHRSYLDFLLVSYVAYQYDLPLPVIAAAMDFKGMNFFGWLLRNCGAFYIRRTFGTDKLYWAVFTEYVQLHIRNGFRPVEFFVEGTRSRTGKAYVPRIGMLSATLESYFKAEVPDMMLVPISISYDRIVEESIYAYEMLGIPKPKESVSGLLKARSVLSEDYGSVHFHICQPISVRTFSVNTVNRNIHALEPRYINNLTTQEQQVTKDLSYQIVRDQQRSLVTSPWSLMAAVIMQSREGIPVKQLVKEVDWLKRQAANLGAYVDWPGNASSESVIMHYLNLHTNIVSVQEDGLVEPKLEKVTDVQKPLRDAVMLNAANNLMLASYRNQLMHVFLNVALVSLSVNGCTCNCDTVPVEEIYKKYAFLEELLCQDFVFQPGYTRQNFKEALLTLSRSGGLAVEGEEVLTKSSINKHTTFYSQMFEPFLLGYWVLCQHLLSLPHDVHGRPLPRKPKTIAKDAQKLGIRLLQENVIKHYEILSLDLLSNGLASLVNLGAMHRDKREDEPYMSPNAVVVSSIADEIGKYVELPQINVRNFTSNGKPVVLTAKL